MSKLKSLATTSVLALSMSFALPAIAQQQTDHDSKQMSDGKGITQDMPDKQGMTQDMSEKKDMTDKKSMSEPKDGTAAATTPVDKEQVGTADVTPVTEQKPTQFLADNVIGSSVFNNDDESIGVVSDLALNADGKVESVVVSVGGFLGMGSKQVGLPWDSVKRQLAEGQMLLRVAATTEELKNMPEFHTTAEIRSEQEAERARKGTMPATGTGTGTGTRTQ